MKHYFALFDVANDYSLLPVDGKYQFGDLTHAKKEAQRLIDKGRREAGPLSAYKIKWRRTSAAGIRPESLMEWNGFIHDGELVYKIIQRKKNPASKKPGEAPYKHKGYEIWNMGGRHWAYRKPRTDNYVGQFKTVAAAMKAIDKLKNPVKMKPETIKRRAAERKKREKEQRKNLEKRLSEKAKQEGPNSIWAEMLAELRTKNPDKRFTVKQLSEIRKNFGTIKGISPESKTYKDLIVLLDSMPQVQLKQLANAKIKFISGLASNRIKRGKNPMAKKKRSAKQLANDKRLGRMAKARAKKKRGGRRKVAKRKVTKRRANPKRTTRAKSHLQIVFKCKGNAIYFLTLRGSKLGWTLTKGDAIFFSTKSQARHTAQNVTIPNDWSLAIAPSNLPAAGLVADCKRQVAGKA